MRFYHFCKVFFAVIATILFVQAAKAETSEPQKSEPAQVIQENGVDVVVTQIGDVEYHIPTHYMRSRMKKIDEGAVLYTILPDLPALSTTDPRFPEMNRPWPDGNYIHFLVLDVNSTTSHSYRFNVLKDDMGPLKPRPEMFGLNAYYTSHTIIGGKKESKDIPDDLYFPEMYINSEPEDPSVYIICDSERSALPGHHCNEHFSEGRLLYEVDFGKSHLAEWRQIKDSVIQLMQKLRRPLPPPHF
jgi:hypothetical protein